MISIDHQVVILTEITRSSRLITSETRKLLKIFGVKITDFEDKSNELLEKARKAKENGDIIELLTVTEDLIALASNSNYSWLEVTKKIFENENHAYSELTKLLEELKTK